MNIHLLLATVFLVGATVLLYFGYTASDNSAGEQVQETLSGRFVDLKTWFAVFGAGAVICGAILLTLWIGI